MTNDEMNIAIAEICGWTHIREQDYYSGHSGGDDSIRQFWQGEFDGETLPLPDYCNDLNAMHEVEGNLSEEEQGAFGIELACVVIGAEFIHIDSALSGIGYFSLMHAKALQHAQAFLKTKGIL